MQLSISDANLNELLAQTILQTITREERDKILAKAIQHLMMPVRNSYSGETVSPIQAAFNEASRDVARKIILDDLTSNEEFKAQVKKMWADVAQKLFEEKKYEDVISQMADRIADGLSRASR